MVEIEDLSVSVLPSLPFSMILCGASMSGKSRFLNKILLHWNELFPSERIRRVVLVHKFANQPCYTELQNHFGEKLLMTKEFGEDLLTNDKIGRPETGVAIFIIDDCLHEIVNDSLLVRLVTGAVHHLRICTFIVAHQLYASRHPNWLTCARNISCIALFQSPRDMSVLSHLNRQLFPKQSSKSENYVVKAYEMAKSDQLEHNDNPYGYLLIDCSLECPQKCRLRTGLLKVEEKFCYVTPF